MFNNMLMGAAGESIKATSFSVDNSAMFNKADAEYLAADSGFGTPSNADVGTLSMWFKRGNLGGTNLRLFTHGSGASVQVQAYLTSSNTLVVGNGTEVTTTQVFRDPHAWYNLVVRVDTSQGTSSNRVRLYLNGSQITSFSASSYPSQNADVFTSTGWRIGSWTNSTTHTFDGYMSEVVYCDGQSLGPTSFGETDSNGVWRPIDVSGLTFGNNGFYLPFSAGTGAALGSNSAGSKTFTPAAANYTYNSTYLTIGSGTIDNNGAPGVSGRLNNPFSGDFTFSFTATAIAGSIFGCFDADELSTFATGTDDGGLDGMTKSWWYDDGGNGSGGAGSVGAGKIMYGNATQASSAIAAGSAVTITRTGSTIKITDDGSDHHTFSQTHEGPVYIMVGNRNITSKSMNFDAVSMTGSEAFAAVNSPTQSSDSPTKNYAVLSPLSLQANIALSEGNLKQVSSSNSQGMSLSSFPVKTGQKVYIEATLTNTGGETGCLKATATTAGNPSKTFDDLDSGDARLLNVNNGDVFTHDGTALVSNYAPNQTNPTTHMIALDLVNDKIYWGDASVGSSGWSNGSGSYNQAFGSAVGVDLDANLDWFFAFKGYNATIEVNFGQKAFTVDPPTGYSSGYSAAIEYEASAPAIEDPDDHFKEVIVDHDGSSTNFTIPWSTYNGTNGTYDTLFSIKRLADEKWFVIDSIRGLNKYFSWNATTSQSTDANVLSVSGTTGTLGSTLADDNYLVQMYRLNAQSSRDTSNSEGSITGSGNSLIISANATAGWSVCTYTGTGSAGTFGHGLSQAPEWIRWYNTVSADGQTVYHAFNPSTPKDHYGNFDSAPTTLTNDDSTKFNDTAPTADVNSVGSADSTNGNTDTMWCFSIHSVESFSKVGAFVGNGVANGPFAEAPISPKSVVLKNANGSASGDDWYLVTDTRFLYNGDASTLAFNLTATEQATNLFDMVSNGIKLRTTNAGVNENTNTIVYQIIGSPFAGTTPATAR